jgi:hypothetical protein
MSNREELTKAYYEWFGPTTHAVTFVYNRNNVSLTKGGEMLREYHRLVDQKRLGGKFYRASPEDRLWFRVVTEKWDIHPHCHGIIRLPADDLAANGLEAIDQAYNQIWQSVIPGGSLKIQPVTDPLAWVNYASKEHDLLNNALALDTLMIGPKQAWTLSLRD